jgi:tetratricopeptide (TPR) repeat protein
MPAAVALLGRGRYQEAIGRYHQILGLDSTLIYADLGLAWSYIMVGNEDAAVRYMNRAFRDMHARTDTSLVKIWIRAAINPSTRAVARATLASKQDLIASWDPEIQASLYASVGDSARALSILEQIFRTGGYHPPGAAVVPLYAPIRNHPRFRALLLRYGLTPP